MHAKLGKNRFATQIYSRLTNANPELVMAFMRAGQGHRPIKVRSSKSLECPSLNHSRQISHLKLVLSRLDKLPPHSAHPALSRPLQLTVHVAAAGQVESRRGRHTNLASLASSGYQQSTSGEAGLRAARADSEATTVGGAGFGWGSSKGKGLVPGSARDVLDPNHGVDVRGRNEAGRGGEGGEGGEGGGLGAGRMAVKAAMRFKRRARKGGGDGGGGGGGGSEGAEVTSISSHGVQSHHRGLAAGSEVNSKGVRASDHLSRGLSSGHVEVLYGSADPPPKQFPVDPIRQPSPRLLCVCHLVGGFCCGRGVFCAQRFGEFCHRGIVCCSPPLAVRGRWGAEPLDTEARIEKAAASPDRALGRYY